MALKRPDFRQRDGREAVRLLERAGNKAWKQERYCCRIESPRCGSSSLLFILVKSWRASMKITREDLDSAVREGVLQADQAAALWSRLERPNAARQSFDLAHVAYYFGALVVMSAMGWFMTLGWERYGGGGILTISAVYAALFVMAGRTLWLRENLTVP